MKITWISDGKRAAAVMGVFLIVVAGVGMIALGGVAADNPFIVSDGSTDTSTTAGTEGTADEAATPVDDENSTPPRTAESDSESSDEQGEDKPGVNFVPGVRNFSISTKEFDASSYDVEDGFVTPGEHRLLRFDTIIYNLGDADAKLGRPEDHSDQDQFEHSDSHDHAHLKGFNEYALFDESGKRMDVGKKQTFCLRDNFQVRSNASSVAQFNCDYQGISAGWADVYPASLPGQYLVIDELPDGEYTIHATTNAAGTIDEKCASDNTVRVDLRITNNIVIVQTPQSQYVRPSAC